MTWEPEENLTNCQEAMNIFVKEEKTRTKIKQEQKKQEQDGEYEVARILDVKFPKSGGRDFMIRWRGHGAEDDTWEPERNLDCSEMIKRFMERHQQVTRSAPSSILTPAIAK